MIRRCAVFAFALLAVFGTSAMAQEETTDLSGDWVGEYVCNQGLTGLTLRVRDTSEGPRAVFVFYEAAANPGVPDGCFEMAGRFDAETGALDFIAGVWIHRPRTYVTVDLTGEADLATGGYHGVVHGPNCGAFTLQRGAPAPGRDHPCFKPVGVSQADSRRIAQDARPAR